METIDKKVLTRRAGFLVMLLLVAAASLTTLAPTKAYAICCGWETITTYYSDATKTVVVGECDADGCAGTTDCWGSTSAYYTRSRTCCDHCLP